MMSENLENQIWNKERRIDIDDQIIEIASETENKDNEFILIKNHIENNNRYLDPNFSLEVLATETKMSNTKVSNIINNQSEFNFRII